MRLSRRDRPARVLANTQATRAASAMLRHSSYQPRFSLGSTNRSSVVH